MKPLRVILIYPGYPPEEYLGGGISTFAKEAAEGLVRLGHRVTVISRTEESQSSVERKNGLKIIRVPGNPRSAKRFKFLAFNNFGLLPYAYKIKRIVENEEQREGKFDVIETGDWGAEALFLLHKYGRRLIIRCHTPSFVAEKFNPANQPYLSGLIKKLEKYILAKAQYIASPSPSLIREIKKFVKIGGLVKIQPYPLRVKSIPYRKNYQEKFGQNRPFNILVAGRLEQRKGQDIVCRAFNELCRKGYQTRLTFAGADTPLKNGSYFKKSLLKIIRPEFSGRVKFLGQVKRRDMPGLFLKHDLFVMCSRFESFGFVTLEAMRAGLPVIAADVCEAKSIIDDGKTGLLFKNDNYLDLSDKIIGLINHPARVKTFGLAARKQIKKTYGNQRPVKQMADYYLKIINRK